MEPLSFAVGIIGLAGLFSTCLDVLNRFDSWQDFGSDSRNLSAQFKAHKLRLENWGQAVGFKDGGISDVHDKALDDPRVMSTVKELLSAVKDVCCFGEELFSPSELTSDRMAKRHMLSRSHTRPNLIKESKVHKLNWALRDKAKRITQVEQFASLVNILYNLVPIGNEKETPFQIGLYKASGGSLIHSNGILFDRQDLNAQFRGMMIRLETEMEVEVKRDIHKWLLGGHLPNETYARSTERRIEGTCDWILSTPWFLHWYSHDFPVGHPKILWVNAPAGFGKSVLCAKVVDHLAFNLKEPVSHFFFSTDAEREDHFVAIRTWLSQMMSHPRIFAIIRDVWALQQGVKATRHEIIGLLRDIVIAVPGCTLILDGLDECSRMGDRRDDSIAGFLDTIAQVTAQTRTRLLIFSRDEPEIRDSLSAIEDVLLIQQKITPNLVRPDIDIYSRSVVRRKLAKKTEAIQEDISQKLADRCNGQFLWIKLQEGELRSTTNQKALQRIINATPAGLEDAYERNWVRISRLSDENRMRAFRILRWAAFALRPLTISEMAGALLVGEEEDEVLVDDIPDEIDEDYIGFEILKDCNSLLEIRSPYAECLAGMKTVHLAHFSVKEYLLLHIPTRSRLLQLNSTLGSSSELAESIQLAKMCLRYLNCVTIWDSTTEQSELFSSFRNYAAELWQQHSSLHDEKDGQLTDLIRRLFDTENPTWSYWKEWFDSNDKDAKKDDRNPEFTSSSPMWYAASLGITDVVQGFINSGHDDIDQRGNRGLTALAAACSRGHLETSKILLNAGADMASTTIQGSSPLYLAAVNGHVEVVQLLVDEGADVKKSQHIKGFTPLHAATHSGHRKIVQLLLENGAEPSTVNANGGTPLYTASVKGYTGIVSLLIKAEANIDAAVSTGYTPLNAALSEGHLDIAKTLLINGACIQGSTEFGWSSLHFASRNGSLDIVKILIDMGANLNLDESGKETPLFIACCYGHFDVAFLLISHGANVNIRDELDRTPLDSASHKGHVDVVKLLLEHGAKKEATDSDGWTALINASDQGHLEVVQLLLDNGAEMEATDNQGWTALCSASYRGHTEIVSLLLDRGAEIDAADNLGWSALLNASNGGHYEVIQLLLDNSADIEAKTKHGWTALNNASFEGRLDIVKLLLGHGADTKAANRLGLTALHTAATKGHVEVVRLLLDNGADTEAANSFGHTALSAAATKGHVEVARLLLEHGADPEATGNAGLTALSYASENGHLGVVRLFFEASATTIQALDKWGRTILWYAASRGQIAMVNLCLANNVPVDLADHWGSTCLFAAVRNGCLEVAKQLITATSLTVRTRDGLDRTLFWWAKRSGSIDVVELLLQHAENTSVKIPEEELQMEISFCDYGKATRRCDVCFRYIGSGDYYRKCQACFDFDICLECFGLGARCLEPSHEMNLNEPNGLPEKKN